MAKLKSKGTVLQESISSGFTAVAQIQSLTSPAAEVGTYDATCLDSGVGREHNITGYVEGGSVSGTLFFDPALAGHQSFTDKLTTPTHATLWKIIWPDTTEWPFGGPLKKFGPVKAGLNDGLMADFEIKVNGLVTYPT